MGEDVMITPDGKATNTGTGNPPVDGRQKGRRNHRRNQNKSGLATIPVKTGKFEGRCDELKGHVYDCSNPRQAADEYTRTTKEIAEYTGIRYGAEVKMTIETLRKPILPVPDDPPTGATVTQIRIWERRVDAYVKAEVTLESDL